MPSKRLKRLARAASLLLDEEKEEVEEEDKEEEDEEKEEDREEGDRDEDEDEDEDSRESTDKAVLAWVPSSSSSSAARFLLRPFICFDSADDISTSRRAF